MKHEIFYVDAFSNKAFTGNPAAVIFQHFDEKIMQQIAAENNLSETAFIKNNHTVSYTHLTLPTTMWV